MSPEERDAIVSICVLAALADGVAGAERDEVKKILGNLATSGAGSPSSLYERVLMNETSVENESKRLTTPQEKQLAFEMATCVCDADGAMSAAERAFLDRLQTALGLTEQFAAPVRQQADDMISSLDVEDPPSAKAATPSAPPMPARANESEIDALILNGAILNAALELLPQSLATMAIIPLQTRMVYRIGTKYGYSLDAGHITEFIGTVGIGMTGQVFENFARKLFGGFGRLAGGWVVGGIASMATGPATTFATTYAMGMVAKQYYGGGRTLRAIDLKAVFAKQFESAKGLYQNHARAIGERASTLDALKVMQLVRGA